MVKFAEYNKPEIIDGKRSYMTEMIGGIRYDRTGDTLRHQQVRQNLIAMLTERMEDKLGGCVAAGVGICFDDNNFLIPNVFGFRAESRLVTEDIECVPDLVVEVVSPDTKRRDLTIKKDVYERFGVGEYWIVDPKAESVDIYGLNPISQTLGLMHCCHNIGVDNEWWGNYKEPWEREEAGNTIKSVLLGEMGIPLDRIFCEA